MAGATSRGVFACATDDGWYEVNMITNTGILVVAAQRDLRRNAFDALDQAGYSHIHSARDVPHAAILLEGIQSLQLIVVVFSGDQRQAQACCEQLRQLPGADETPLMAVLSEEASFGPAEMPSGVLDWIHGKQINAELVVRWRQALARLPECLQTQDEPFGGAREDYRFLFDEGDLEWLMVEPQTNRLLEVSPTVIRHSRIPEGQWQGLSLSEALQFEGVTFEQVQAEVDRNWHPCRRKSC